MLELYAHVSIQVKALLAVSVSFITNMTQILTQKDFIC